MQKANEMRDRLINEFAENYMEKLFYFCLKKTGNHIEAEDMTQDIALQIITALNKGTIPTSFSAWVWQIARNCYSVWAKEKHKRNESVTGSDISDYEIEDESENILDEIIHTEQIAL
ncbi:MAG: sigma-70 family RNA polymerase sigma factor, partial [Clostridia bacterium]|nr:sigma-70 family RNA polymerase sigma factor [Clostridia bacterium]